MKQSVLEVAKHLGTLVQWWSNRFVGVWCSRGRSPFVATLRRSCETTKDSGGFEMEWTHEEAS